MPFRFCILHVLMLLAFQVRALGVPERAEVLAGYDRHTVEERMGARRLDGLEGLWSYPEERLTLAVERTDVGGGLPEYRLVVVESDDTSIDCGSVAGYMQCPAEPGKIRLWLYSLAEDGRLSNPVECVGNLSEDNAITIRRTKLKFHVSANLTRFLPTVFGGVRIYPRLKEEKIEPGMRKVWPAGANPDFVIF